MPSRSSASDVTAVRFPPGRVLAILGVPLMLALLAVAALPVDADHTPYGMVVHGGSIRAEVRVLVPAPFVGTALTLPLAIAAGVRRAPPGRLVVALVAALVVGQIGASVGVLATLARWVVQKGSYDVVAAALGGLGLLAVLGAAVALFLAIVPGWTRFTVLLAGWWASCAGSVVTLGTLESILERRALPVGVFVWWAAVLAWPVLGICVHAVSLVIRLRTASSADGGRQTADGASTTP